MTSRSISPRSTSTGGNVSPPGDVRYDAAGATQPPPPAGDSEPPAEPPARPLFLVRACQTHIARSKAFVMRHRIDDPRRGLVFLLSTCVPFLVFFVVRLAESPSHRSADAGCVYDTADATFAGVVSALILSAAYPAISSLAEHPDSHFLRMELTAQVITWQPVLLWLIFDYSRPNNLSTMKGIYGILIGCLFTLVASLWAPALIACARTQSRSRVMPTADGLPDARARQRLVNSPALLAKAPPATASELESESGSGAPHQLPLPPAQETVAAPAATPPESPVAGSFVLDDGAVAVAVHSALESVMLCEMSTVAARFLSPAPTMLELVSTLKMPLPSLRQSDRSLSVFAAMLFATGSGMALLEETLRLSLNAELLGFLVDADDLRRGARDLLAGASTGGPVPALATLPSNARLLSRFVDAFSHFLTRYVAHGAPHYINVGRNALTLMEAARSLRLRRRGFSAAAAADIAGALRSLAAAEVDVFERLVFEPLVWRMRTHPYLFVDWSAEVLRELEEPGAAPSSPSRREEAGGRGLLA